MSENYYSRIGLALVVCAVLPAFCFRASAAETPPAVWDFSSGIDGFTILNIDQESDAFSYNRWSENVSYSGGYGDVADDYLVLPPLTLKAGMAYEVRYSAYANWFRIDWEPRLSWHIGEEATAEALSRTVAPEILFPNSSSADERTFTFSVENDGVYYLAARLCAGEAQGSVDFFIEDISVEAGVAYSAPAAPALTITPVIRDGKLAADIELVAPAVTIGGKPLGGELTYSVSDAEKRYTATGSVMPGAAVSLSDAECPANGTVYTAYVSSGDVDGKEVRTQFTPVFDTPAAPANITLTREGDNIVISWDAVTVGENGGLFNPATVVYSVQRGDRQMVATKTTATSVTDTPPVPEEGQTQVYYTVTAYGNADSYSGTSSESPRLMLGSPYSGMFAESFAGAKTSTQTWTVGPDGASYSAWKPSTASYSSPECRESSDGDGGFLLFSPSSYYDGTEFISPLIDMAGAANASLELDVFGYTSAPDEAVVSLYVEQDGARMLLEGGELKFRADADGWERRSFPLASELVAAGPFSIVFVGRDVASAKALIDNIVVRNVPERNLLVGDVAAAADALPGEELVIDVAITNNGAEDVPVATVTLTGDGKVVAESEPFRLGAGESSSVQFTVAITPFMAGRSVRFTAAVYAEGDMVEDDNNAAIEVSVGVCDLPVPGAISAVHGSEGAEIRWNAPLIDETPDPVAVAESFEDWAVGTTVPQGGWVFIDVDGAPKYGLAGVNEDSAYAFFVADTFSTSSVASMEAADGKNALVTTKNADYSATDVWLITPPIDPSEPVSFQATAMAFRGYAPARFEVGWLPAGTVDREAFVKIRDVETGGYDWESVSCDLPAEAARFVIRVSDLQDNACAFDDFHFLSIPETPVLTGYNLYRGGTRIAVLGSDVLSYTDFGVDRTIENVYHVSCVYAPGREAMDLAGFSLAPAPTVGIDQVTAPTEPFTLRGRLLVSYAVVDVFTADGRFRGRVAAGGSLALDAGLYVLISDGRTFKAAVR